MASPVNHEANQPKKHLSTYRRRQTSDDAQFGFLGIRYIMQLVALTNSNITTTGSISLSTELWNMILGFALVDA